jgi:hypothetical protein
MRLPGIANKGAVSKARRRALDAIRAPAVAEYRATVLAELDALSAGAWEDVRDPGPKTSVTGTVVKDPQTGEPLPDKTVRDQARNTILKAVRLRMDLLGLAAPKKSMSLNATMELDQENEVLQAELAEAYGAALAPSVTVDGRSVPVTETETGLLNIVLPADNLFGQPAGTTGLSFGHGWVALLNPLTPGTHTIAGSGSATFTTTIIVQPGS